MVAPFESRIGIDGWKLFVSVKVCVRLSAATARYPEGGSAIVTGLIVQISISPGGIPKRAITEAMVTREGIVGDGWAHPRFHGGPKQAILLMCAEVIEQLRAGGYAVFHGALGENFTVRGLDHRALRPGQRFRAGQAVIELTKVRVPCETLDVYSSSIKAAIYGKAVKAGDTTSPLWARSGMYASVVQPGVVRPDDIIALMDAAV
jgi:MOSC domain-containing protein YiiM